MTDGTATFAERLRTSRRSVGLSQEELAARSGLSVRAIGNLERGRIRWPHPGSVRRLADALRLSGQARQAFVAAADRHLADVSDSRSATVAAGGPIGVGGPQVVPGQLPPSIGEFVGREHELAALTRLLQRNSRSPGAVVISAIGGMAGIGKTALALHWAHQVADRFPDGQLYVNLRGFDPSGTPVSPEAALRGLLDALGVPAERIPADLTAQTGLYRSLLSGRRMLVLLDNARDSAQVRPLLPGSTGCLVVVTSRSRLAGMVAAEGARSLTLDVLDDGEARELLARRLGAARLDAEPGAAAGLSEVCGGLPLALAIASARASVRPGLALAVLVEELKRARSRLDALETGDGPVSVRAVFSWSLGRLQPEAVRMFGLLSVHPGPDITVPAAASLAGVSLSEAYRVLGELADANLIIEQRGGRFGMHDLLRAYAAERCAAADDVARRAAPGRIVDHYLYTAAAAALLLYPTLEPIALSPPRPGVTPEHLAGQREALAWFEAERRVLIAAVTLAADSGHDACAWQLAWAIAKYLDWRGLWHEWAAVQRIAVAAASRLGDTCGHATARRALASACARLGCYEQARAHLAVCLRLCRQLGDRAGEARLHATLSWVCGRQGRDLDALGHAEQALALYQAAGDQAGKAVALNNLGCSHARVGDHQQARLFCQQAVALYQELGDRHSEASAWDSLGYAEHMLGNLAQAADCYRRALTIFREFGNRYCEADTLTHLGDTHHASGEPEPARQAWQRALDILHDLEHPDADQVRAKLHQARPASPVHAECASEMRSRLGTGGRGAGAASPANTLTLPAKDFDH